MKELHAAIPPQLREKKTVLSMMYIGRDIACFAVVARLGLYLEFGRDSECAYAIVALRIFLWINYWFWQSMVFASFFTMAHEAGHDTLSPHKWLNHAIGFMLHTVTSLLCRESTILTSTTGHSRPILLLAIESPESSQSNAERST